jgi:hexokinase
MLLYLIDFSVLFDGHSSSILNTHYGLDTALVSEIEAAKSDDEVIKVLTKDLGMAKEVIKPEDVQIVKWACRIVSSRAASLSACALAAVVLHTGRAQSNGTNDTIDIGMDGR